MVFGFADSVFYNPRAPRENHISTPRRCREGRDDVGIDSSHPSCERRGGRSLALRSARRALHAHVVSELGLFAPVAAESRGPDLAVRGLFCKGALRGNRPSPKTMSR